MRNWRSSKSALSLTTRSPGRTPLVTMTSLAPSSAVSTRRRSNTPGCTCTTTQCWVPRSVTALAGSTTPR